LAISLIAFDMDDSNTLNLTIRLLALNGYIALRIAAAMTPFLKEITLFFQKILHHSAPLLCRYRIASNNVASDCRRD
jgi:hypothetical protein